MIKVIHIRENEDDFTVFFTIDIDDENFEFHADTPKDKEQQKWLEDNQDFIRFLILQKMYCKDDIYPDWQRFKTEENDNYLALQDWIAAGHKNQIIVGYYKNGNPIYKYIVIEKQPWISTHPPELKLTDKIDSLTVTPDLKSVLKDIIMR